MSGEIIIEHECIFIPMGEPLGIYCKICGKSIEEDVELPPPEVSKPLEFIKYKSITNSKRKKFIENIRNQDFDRMAWVATNKIHGTNFSVWADAETVRFARRNGWIELDEKFFNHDLMKKHLTQKVKELQLYFGKNTAIFFEMFGGSYNHPEVTPLPKFDRIAKGVQYCPFSDIRVIDIFVDEKFIDWDDMVRIAEGHGLRTTKVLERGSFESILALDPVFPDPVHTEYNLPVIEGNDSEGYVLRPVKECIMRNGKRCIIKHKNPKFSEKKIRVSKIKEPLKEEVQKALNELVSGINTNRLDNILSHGHKFGEKEFMKLSGLFVQDILKEEADEDYLTSLEKADFRVVKKMLTDEVNNFIRPLFFEMIEE